MQDGKKIRGRPRAFDEGEARRKILETFWERGLAAVSLDDLSEATAMKRPSLYGAFGNKEAMYLQALRDFGEHFREPARQLLKSDDCRKGLEGFFAGALELYHCGDRGCMLVCTAATEAPSSPAVRAVLEQVLADLDRLLVRQFSRFYPDGEVRGKLAASLLHSLAVRIRAGLPEGEVKRLKDEALDLLCRS